MGIVLNSPNIPFRIFPNVPFHSLSFPDVVLLSFSLGGEVSGTIDDCLRNAISKLAQFHVVSNDLAKRRLLAMGEEEERIVVTGCPSYDSLLTTNVR